MSALVEIWGSELTKLREKVRLRKVLKAKEETAEMKEEKKGKRPEMKEDAGRAETTMSEATVCLLMDRFVPW
ncbi:hypothetical protein CDL15_Pgr004198 [Punica granatum]|uniref:Uncharacterized protein n=1 Tax=Punica granatum TaxID=22663 RepID=A0A218XFN0_PUNGR|nr:hypothetical protein CDL15_Pgr004198 [Punica granatum]PKI47502.1 hypothetical protein CRG98_032092 [Punica granatum]